MKLRNKKTGEIGEIRYENHALYIDTNEGFTYWVRTIARLNADWEDVEGIKAPLIKDEKIRKIIQEWAGENDATRLDYYSPENELVDCYGNSIRFNLMLNELDDHKAYTIAELCGDSKEDEDEA